MTTYTLKVQIDTAGRKKMDQYGQKVAIIKSFQGQVTFNVVWLAFEPFGDENIIQFYDEYSLYASLTPVIAGRKPAINLIQQVSGGYTYTFENGAFDSGKAGLQAGRFGFCNLQKNDTQTLTTGLAQKIIDLRGSISFMPINATQIPYNETVYFAPLEKIKVFAGSNIESSLILDPGILHKARARAAAHTGQILTRYIELDFASTLSQTIHYDNALNQFALGPLTG